MREVIRKINFREVDEVVSGPETVTRKDHPTPSMPLSSPLVSSSSSCTDNSSAAGTRDDTLDLNENGEESSADDEDSDAAYDTCDDSAGNSAGGELKEDDREVRLSKTLQDLQRIFLGPETSASASASAMAPAASKSAECEIKTDMSKMNDPSIEKEQELVQKFVADMNLSVDILKKEIAATKESFEKKRRELKLSFLRTSESEVMAIEKARAVCVAEHAAVVKQTRNEISGYSGEFEALFKNLKEETRKKRKREENFVVYLENEARSLRQCT